MNMIDRVGETVSLDAKRRAVQQGSPDRLGRVVSVSGSQVMSLLDSRTEEAPVQNVQIGALVKMRTPLSTVYALISGLSIPIPAETPTDSELKIVELELLGEAPHDQEGEPQAFQRGVSTAPSLGDDVFATTQEDLRRVYARPLVSNVRVGTIHQDRALPAFVVTDDLLGKHFAILGTTGSGKSCAVALILRAILTQHSQGHVVLMDLHNEYSAAFGDWAEVLTPETLDLPYWLLNFEEMKEIMIGAEKDREPDAAILHEVIVAAKRAFSPDLSRSEGSTVDTPTPYKLSDMTRLLDESAGKLDRPGDAVPYRRLKARLAALQSDRRFAFMFPSLSVRDNMAAILSRLFRIPVHGKPITILDLSRVPSEILNVVVSMLCRMTFDIGMWSDQKVPTLLVCEEAHRYVPADAKMGFEPTKRSLSRIAREGRKYGVSLCIVSQRPSELAPEVLSQCNTIFALRMSNMKDQDFVRSALSESALGLMESLPSLGNAEAIAAGEGVSVPVRLCFDELPPEFQPRSRTASFAAAWDNDLASPNFVQEIVERWRRQRR